MSAAHDLLYSPSGNKVIVRYKTVNTEVSMNFETVAQAREYLAYIVPKKKAERVEAILSGSFAEPLIIEDSIAIYDDGKLVS